MRVLVALLCAVVMMPQSVQVRAATTADDSTIAQHFYQMWLDNQISATAIVDNWLEVTLLFIQQARQTLGYQAFIAVVDDQVVGSAGGQRFAGLYPNIMQATERLDGYIWGVYVEPSHRHQGIATELTRQVINYLYSMGCTHVTLNAAPSGKAIYTRLGFLDSNLMRLQLG